MEAVIVYKNSKEYVADCIIAAVGSLASKDYSIYPFEEVVRGSGTWGNVCSSFITYVRSMKDPATYATIENFKEYFLKNTGREVLTETEVGSIDLIYSQIAVNKEQSILKDPEILYKSLFKARAKIALKKSLDALTTSDTWTDVDAVAWTDSYCAELTEAVDDAMALFESEDGTGNLLFAEDIGNYYEEKLKERQSGKVYKFGWEPIDNLIPEGPTPGHGGIITGSTGMGKSALCLNMIDHAIDTDIPCIYLPIEMGTENTVDRLMSKRTKIPYKDLVKMNAEDYQAAKAVIDREVKRLKAHSNFAICDDPDINIRKLEMIIKKFQAKIGQQYCLVFIDLLTMVREFYATDANLAQAIEKAINMLDILSKKLGFHYIGVVQLNRSVEQDKVLSIQSIEKLKPTRSAVKNSSALLERARWNLSMFRPKYFADLYLTPEESMTLEDIAEVTLMKANNTGVGRAMFNYDGPTFTLTELDDLTA